MSTSAQLFSRFFCFLRYQLVSLSVRNPENTRRTIIKESANLFNTQGYKATSISDITKATGLTKGAIYRHFESKADLEKQALQSLAKLMFTELGASIRKVKTFQLKMDAIFTFFETYMHSPLYKGGCPLLNAAVEVDDTNPVLREQTCNMLAQLKTSVSRLIDNGIKNHQVKPSTDAQFYSTIFIASLEGGIMMSRLERNEVSIATIIDHLKGLVRIISV